MTRSEIQAFKTSDHTSMRILLILLLALASALAQRWEGAPEYRAISGAPTSAGPNLDRSYILDFAAQGRFKGTIVLVPGFLGGATNFEALARRLVLAAPGWEVWAWDRRSNGLEDRSGFSTPDPWTFYRNYKIPAFPFLKDWGLKVHLDDLDAVIGAAKARGPVVLAGHSLGASIVCLYALYRPEKLDGLILLDGGPNLVRVTKEQYLNGDASGRLGFGPAPGLNDLLTGKTPPYTALFGLDPLSFAQAEAQAYMAAQDPQADAPPGWVKYPSSRIAAALARIAARYQPVPIFAVSVGRAEAREGINLVGLFLNTLSFTVRGPRGRRVEWQDTGDATDPIEFLQLYAHPNTGFSEWFFPYRLTLDISAWDVAMPELKPRGLPFSVLALGAGNGLLQKVESFKAVGDVLPGTKTDIRILPGLTHLDLLVGRNGPAVGPIAEYLKAVR